MASKDTNVPSDQPPSYQVATSTGASDTSKPTHSSHLEVPGEKNGIPAAHRRSMEDEIRSLPPGWMRQFDAKEGHQFFVDTRADPPRSIWVHPYDDDQYLSILSSEEREQIQAEEAEMRRPMTPGSVDERHYPDEKKQHLSEETYPSDLPERPDQGGRHGSTTADGKKKGLGERFKNKVTGTTKEEREREKAKRAEQERQYYEAHMRFRQAMRQAQIDGTPQPLGKDRDGHDLYVLPPQTGYGGYGGFSNQVRPSPIYNDANARFIQAPRDSYGRPYGYGGTYGGGYGYGGYGGYGGGLGLPILGGLAGGALLGGLLF